MSKLVLRVIVPVALSLLAAGCAEDEGTAASGADLPIERRVGYAVVVDDEGSDLMIALNEDRDAVSGEAFDVTESVWRIDEGPWNEPPVTCLSLGQRVELGITQVQRENQPGLLHDRVVWLSCLAPVEE